MSVCEQFFIQNASQIITVFASLSAAVVGGFVSSWTYRKQIKAEEKKRCNEEKLAAYIELLSACQSIRDLATEYASRNQFPDEGQEHKIALNNYCHIINKIQNASIRAKLYSPDNLSNLVSHFYDIIYQDFVFYMQYGLTKLSNDSSDPNSNLKSIIDEISRIEKMIQDDVKTLRVWRIKGRRFWTERIHKT